MQTPTTQTQTMQTPATQTQTLSHTTMQTPTTQTQTLSHTTMQTMQTVEFDFENDDDAFYDFIDFGIASNGGRLSIR